MSVLDKVLSLADRVRAPREAQAHCDIPCGIYDPHAAQVAALTCVRMVQLINALEQPGQTMVKAQVDTYAMQMSRYTDVKETHASIVEHELVTLWVDYFKPEHLEKYPKLHDTFWKATKLTGPVKQQVSMELAQQLLASCQEIAEIFWATKGVKTRRQPSNQGAVGGEFVYPVAG
jgi:nickel superoxide dismutase